MLAVPTNQTVMKQESPDVQATSSPQIDKVSLTLTSPPPPPHKYTCSSLKVYWMADIFWDHRHVSRLVFISFSSGNNWPEKKLKIARRADRRRRREEAVGKLSSPYVRPPVSC